MQFDFYHHFVWEPLLKLGQRDCQVLHHHAIAGNKDQRPRLVRVAYHQLKRRFQSFKNFIDHSEESSGRFGRPHTPTRFFEQAAKMVFINAGTARAAALLAGAVTVP